MIIDIHTHIFPPEVQRHREKFCARDLWFNHLYQNPRAKIATAEALITEMDASGVDISVVTAFGWTDGSLMRAANDYALDAMRRYPGRVYAMAGVLPRAGEEAVYELERCAQAGMVGLGELMPHGQGYSLSDVALLQPVIEVARYYNLLVLSHCSEPVGHLYPGKGNVSLLEIEKFLIAFNDVRFIAAHWGGGLPFYTLMPELRRLTANVWYDTAATVYLYRQAIVPIVAQLVGADRILFASDFGLLRQRRIIDHISQSSLGEEDVERVLGGNARQLLNV